MTENALVPSCRVAVVGAGPYGLAVAAHLRSHGLEIRVFGEPMEYWSGMPRGMLLRSPWHASSISDPDDAFTLDAYEAARGVTLRRPIPLEDFIAYGRWFQEHVVPDLDRRRVATIAGNGEGFRLELTDGSAVHARRVVVATGLLAAAHRLPLLADLPPERCSHTADLRDPAEFGGMRVVVIGGGQSATESAALLHEAGADVELVVRAPQMRWLVRSGRLHRSRLRPLLYPDTDVGPPVLNQIVSRPRLFRCFPRAWQERMAYRAIRPAAAGWLKPRLRRVAITYGRTVVAAAGAGDEIVVRLDDGSERRVDHVVQGTGFRLDVGSHPLLAPALARRVRSYNGYPELGPGFESSVEGLHFVGAMSAVSIGPVMRFVSGTWATGPGVARAIVAAERGAGARDARNSRQTPVVADAGQPAS